MATPNKMIECPHCDSVFKLDEEPKELVSANRAVANALLPYLSVGERVIYRDAFRWCDESGHALSHHYEMNSIEFLAETFGYEIVLNFNHVAVIRNKGEKIAII